MNIFMHVSFQFYQNTSRRIQSQEGKLLDRRVGIAPRFLFQLSGLPFARVGVLSEMCITSTLASLPFQPLKAVPCTLGALVTACCVGINFYLLSGYLAPWFQNNADLFWETDWAGVEQALSSNSWESTVIIFGGCQAQELRSRCVCFSEPTHCRISPQPWQGNHNTLRQAALDPWAPCTRSCHKPDTALALKEPTTC